MNIRKRTFSILIANEVNAIMRLLGVFSRRDFEYESLNFGRCEVPDYLRLTLVIIDNDYNVSQILRQLAKIIAITKIEDLTDKAFIQREILLLKLRCNSNDRPKIIEIANIFKLTIIDYNDEMLTLQIIGNSAKLLAIENFLKPFQTVEFIRTGVIALERDSGIDATHLKHQPITYEKRMTVFNKDSVEILFYENLQNAYMNYKEVLHNHFVKIQDAFPEVKKQLWERKEKFLFQTLLRNSRNDVTNK